MSADPLMVMGALHPATRDLLREARDGGIHLDSMCGYIERVRDSLMDKLHDGGVIADFWRGQRMTEICVRRSLTTIRVTFTVRRSSTHRNAGRSITIEFSAFASEAILATLRFHIPVAKGVRP